MIKSILFAFTIIGTAALDSQECRTQHHADWFCDYMSVHNRTYDDSNVHFRKRRLSMSTEYEFDGVKFGLTSRSDRFGHEMKKNKHLKDMLQNPLARNEETQHVHLAAPSKLPPIDWRNHDGVSYVTPVLDQGECGCCYAFAATSVLEFWSKEDGFPKPLSVQTAMDCTSDAGQPDAGCDGGLMEYVFEYGKNHPIPLSADFPFQEAGGKCPHTRLYSHVRVGAYKVLMRSGNRNAEKELEWILHAYGPVAAGIDSSTLDDYQSGIFKASMCSNDIDHAITIVGYTDRAWIIKNSWGQNWGHDGYLYLEKGHNACGISEYIVYVTNAWPVHHKYTTRWKPKWI